MWRRRRVTAIILAAGSSSRMGGSENKMYAPLGGLPLLQYTLEAFDRHPAVDALILTARPAETERTRALLDTMALAKPYRIVSGGETRQASVRQALALIKTPVVIVHDGARPFISHEHISACLDALHHHQGAILALPLEEPIYRAPTKKQGPVRFTETLFAVQTPQCFYTKILKRCHKKHETHPGVTDDSSLLELEGHRVGVVTGDSRNFKITTPLDLSLAQAYIER